MDLLATTRERFVKGVGASLAMLALSYLTNFALVPLTLHYWGPTGYGVWVTLFTAVTYLSLVDIGGQVYVQNLLSIDFAQKNADKFRRVLWEGVSLYLVIGVLAFLVWAAAVAGMAAMPMPLLHRVLSPTESRVLLLLGVNQLIVGIPLGVFNTCYRATGHFTRGAVLGYFNKVLLFGAAVTVICSGGGVVGMSLAYLTVSIVTAIVVLIDSRKSVPWSRPARLSLGDAKRGLPALKGSSFNWLISVSSMVNQQAPVLIVARFLPSEAVAAFATHRTITNVAALVPSIIAGPILPELSYFWSLQRLEAFRTVVVRAVASVILLTAGAALALLVIGPLFFTRWTAHVVPIDTTLLVLLLVQAVTASGATAAGWSLVCANRHRLYSVATCAYSVVVVFVSIGVTPRWGAIGLVGGLIVADLIFIGGVLPQIAERVIPHIAYPLRRATLAGLAVFGGSIGVVGGASRVLPSAWAALAGVLFVGTIGGCLILVLRRRWTLRAV